METPADAKAPKRARLSILFGLGSLITTPIVTFILAWFPVEVAERRLVEYVLLLGLQILCAGMGVACLITAFPEPKNPRSWQGKTAVFLAVFVFLWSLPMSILSLFDRIQRHLNP